MISGGNEEEIRLFVNKEGALILGQEQVFIEVHQTLRTIKKGL